MANERHLANRRITIIYATVPRIFAKFNMMMHNDPLNPTGPNEMLFAGRTRVRQGAILLVAGAQWQIVANATEPSVCSGDAAFCQIALTTCLPYT